MSLKVLMYSFKGGAGRTVSTANIAYALAKEKQKRVLVIDLDVESAGSSVLFEVDDDVERGDCWAIQDVLRGYYVASTPAATKKQGMLATQENESARVSINLNVKDFETRVWPKLHFQVWPAATESTPESSGGYLKFMPARRMLYSPEEVTGGLSATSSFQFLLKRIEALAAAPDIILLDSASGLQNTAMMGFAAANALMIFARWTRQFVKGTIQFVDEYVLSAVGRRLEAVLFVPTAVPRAQPSGKLLEELEKRRSTLEGHIWRANHDATRLFGKPEGWIRMAPAIGEADGLKWDDKILLHEGDEYIDKSHLHAVLTDYRALADLLADMSAEKKAGVLKRARTVERPRT